MGDERAENLSYERVAVIIPCYNEALTISKVVSDFRRELPGAAVWVYDNNSTDDTARLAREAGARVRREQRKGKGNVVRSMIARHRRGLLHHGRRRRHLPGRGGAGDGAPGAGGRLRHGQRRPPLHDVLRRERERPARAGQPPRPWHDQLPLQSQRARHHDRLPRHGVRVHQDPARPLARLRARDRDDHPRAGQEHEAHRGADRLPRPPRRAPTPRSTRSPTAPRSSV